MKLPALLAALAALFGGLSLWLFLGESRPRSERSTLTPGVAIAAGNRASCTALLCRGRDCCEALSLPGGTFRRSYDGVECRDAGYPATVSPFALDTFEVTVARFRAFVLSGTSTRTRPPLPGAGAHPRIAGSGWDPAWNDQLPESVAGWSARLQATPASNWSDQPGAREDAAINGVSWYEAFAFCAWDGGRLPTEAEWNFAASGGDEQRLYPWGSGIDRSQAVYADVRPQAVGSTRGDGRWGHADLAGNVWEWTLDSNDESALLPTTGADPCTGAGYPLPCVDCARLTPGSVRVLRGGGFGIPEKGVRAALRRGSPPDSRHHVFGIRCTREQGSVASPAPAAPPPAKIAAVNFSVGTKLTGVVLSGFRDPSRDRMTLEPLRLDELAPQAGGALVMQVASGWSPLSRQQAAEIKRHRRLAQYVTLLVDGAHPGQRGDTYSLVSWIEAAGVDYPAGIDRQGRLGGEPRLLLIDGRTLEIQRVSTAFPDDDFWRAVR